MFIVFKEQKGTSIYHLLTSSHCFVKARVTFFYICQEVSFLMLKETCKDVEISL